MPEGCARPGEVLSEEFPLLRRGYPYRYRVYLPPCYSADRSAAYPVLYLIPGRSGSPDSWLQAGLAEEMDKLIRSGRVPPLIVVLTVNTETDPLAETIYQELIPYVESRYPVPNAVRYNIWSHLAFTYDGTVMKAYVNGQIAASSAVSGAIRLNVITSLPPSAGAGTGCSNFAIAGSLKPV